MAEENKSSEKPKGLSNEMTDSNIIAALSYFWILSVVLYVLKKDDAFVKFHARQGMVLFGFAIIGMIPVLGWPILVVATIAAVIGALKAYQGERYKMPFVGEWAEKIDF